MSSTSELNAGQAQRPSQCQRVARWKSSLGQAPRCGSTAERDRVRPKKRRRCSHFPAAMIMLNVGVLAGGLRALLLCGTVALLVQNVDSLCTTPGHFLNLAIGACEICPPGTYDALGISAGDRPPWCEPCGIGFYSDVVGATAGCQLADSCTPLGKYPLRRRSRFPNRHVFQRNRLLRSRFLSL